MRFACRVSSGFHSGRQARCNVYHVVTYVITKAGKIGITITITITSSSILLWPPRLRPAEPGGRKSSVAQRLQLWRELRGSNNRDNSSNGSGDDDILVNVMVVINIALV